MEAVENHRQFWKTQENHRNQGKPWETKINHGSQRMKTVEGQGQPRTTLSLKNSL